MPRYIAVPFFLLAGLAFLSGYATYQDIDRRLSRLETIAKYNDDRIEALTDRVSRIQKPPPPPIETAASIQEPPRPLPGHPSGKPPPSFHFRAVSDSDSKIASGSPDLSLFFSEGAYELTPRHKEQLKRLLTGAKGGQNVGLSLTVNAFSSRGADPVLDYHLSASRGLSVYNFILRTPGLPRIREVFVNACGVHFATGRRSHDRRADIILNGTSPQEGGS